MGVQKYMIAGRPRQANINSRENARFKVLFGKILGQIHQIFHALFFGKMVHFAQKSLFWVKN
ncbi:MAG: hypothetical protein JW709_06350 [Sedimentisphaerales bacterium]|nr:hypothetical protein [Sedimentisphaerales bacterium]